MSQHLALVTLVVLDYDDAIAFYVDKLGFTLVEDTALASQGKRWVVLSPPGARESRILLARAANDRQAARAGDQTGGRVGLFLHTDDFWRDHERLSAQGVHFARPPRRETYGTVAVFQDLYGNLWDLIQPNPPVAAEADTLPVIGPHLDRIAECEAVLRTLPGWFGIEHALLMYARDSAAMPTFAVEQDNTLVAFLTLNQHFPAAWEVHCMAVRADRRGQGLGSALLRRAQAWLAQRGVRFLQVKTVAATSSSAEYDETRRFYEAAGFTPLEVFPELWDPWNPALQMLKALDPAGHDVPAGT
jgi:GNAT superfamily N-acetyltransferase